MQPGTRSRWVTRELKNGKPKRGVRTVEESIGTTFFKADLDAQQDSY